MRVATQRRARARQESSRTLEGWERGPRDRGIRHLAAGGNLEDEAIVMRQPGPRVALELVGLLAVGGRALASPTVLSDELADANQLAQRTADAGSHVSQRRQMQGRQRWCLPHRMRAARRFFLFRPILAPCRRFVCIKLSIPNMKRGTRQLTKKVSRLSATLLVRSSLEI